MIITLLGTGSPVPMQNRASSGYLVELDNEILVFDHGAGAHHNFLRTDTGRPISTPSSSRIFTPTTASTMHGWSIAAGTRAPGRSPSFRSMRRPTCNA